MRWMCLGFATLPVDRAERRFVAAWRNAGLVCGLRTAPSAQQRPHWRNKPQGGPRTRIRLLVGIAALGLGIAAPAQSAVFSKARIVVIVKATTSQHWATVFDGARAAAKNLGIQLSTLGATAETDVAGEVTITENAVASKPTAIVIAATNAAALANPITSATRIWYSCERHLF